MPIRNNYFNLITEQCPVLSFLELSPFDKMQFLIGDVSFSLDTNIGLYFDKIGKTMLQQKFILKKSFLENNTTICELIFYFSKLLFKS